MKEIQQGKVEVLGGDMADSRFRASVQPRIAYMPQGLGKNLYASLSVYEIASPNCWGAPVWPPSPTAPPPSCPGG